MSIKLNRRTFLILTGTVAATAAVRPNFRPAKADVQSNTPPLHVMADAPEPPARPRTAAIRYIPS